MPPFLAKYGIYIGLALAVVAILGLAYCKGMSAGKSGDPDKQRALRGCLIMRQQGRDTKNIPACSGPSTGH
jgi:hypothetical protein